MVERAPRNNIPPPVFSQAQHSIKQKETEADCFLWKRSIRVDMQAHNSAVEVGAEFTHSAYILARGTVDCSVNQLAFAF